jgi:hypothetical protein
MATPEEVEVMLDDLLSSKGRKLVLLCGKTRKHSDVDVAKAVTAIQDILGPFHWKDAITILAFLFGSISANASIQAYHARRN